MAHKILFAAVALAGVLPISPAYGQEAPRSAAVCDADGAIDFFERMSASAWARPSGSISAVERDAEGYYSYMTAQPNGEVTFETVTCSQDRTARVGNYTLTTTSPGNLVWNWRNGDEPGRDVWTLSADVISREYSVRRNGTWTRSGLTQPEFLSAAPMQAAIDAAARATPDQIRIAGPILEPAAPRIPPEQARWGLFAELAGRTFRSGSFVFQGKWTDPGKAMLVKWGHMPDGVYEDDFIWKDGVGPVSKGDFAMAETTLGSALMRRSNGGFSFVFRREDDGIILESATCSNCQSAARPGFVAVVKSEGRVRPLAVVGSQSEYDAAFKKYDAQQKAAIAAYMPKPRPRPTSSSSSSSRRGGGGGFLAALSGAMMGAAKGYADSGGDWTSAIVSGMGGAVIGSSGGNDQLYRELEQSSARSAERAEESRRQLYQTIAEGERRAAAERAAAASQQAGQASGGQSHGERVVAQEQARAEQLRQEREARAAEEQRLAQQEAAAKAQREAEARRLAEAERNRPVEWSEGVVLCEPRQNSQEWRCTGPLQMNILRLDGPNTMAQLGIACGSDNGIREIGPVGTYRAFGCGFGIHPTAKNYPGNRDVPADFGVFVSDRRVFHCPATKDAYCRTP